FITVFFFVATYLPSLLLLLLPLSVFFMGSVLSFETLTVRERWRRRTRGVNSVGSLTFQITPLLFALLFLPFLEQRARRRRLKLPVRRKKCPLLGRRRGRK